MEPASPSPGIGGSAHGFYGQNPGLFKMRRASGDSLSRRIRLCTLRLPDHFVGGSAAFNGSPSCGYG